jgi:hypothetical protein
MNSELLKIIEIAKNGEWDKAHDMLQNHKGDTGSWIHAVLHREEGDLSNAAYWYNRAGKTKYAGSIEEEYDIIAKSLASDE